jgi:GNAT superfamily N-acetyltransferase
VETLSTISPNDAAALARLLGQLSTTATFDSGRLHAIIYHEATELLVARVGGEIVRMATFVSFPLPTGLRGHVEDVVVDESMRGRGIARKLRNPSALTIRLTKRPLSAFDPTCLTSSRRWRTVVQCGKTELGISGLFRQALAWVVAQVGGGVAITAARSMHGGESASGSI